jgi:acetyl-CoA C-acetyltransferase
MKPVHTVTTDGITGLASLVMQLETGQMDIAVIEAHSKASNIVQPAHIEAFALDPIFARPLGLHPRFVAGLEMRSFLEETDNTEEQAALGLAVEPVWSQERVGAMTDISHFRPAGPDFAENP